MMRDVGGETLEVCKGIQSTSSGESKHITKQMKKRTQTIPITTVALRLTSSPAPPSIIPRLTVSSSPSQYKLPLFQPQLCPTLKVSGELANRVRAAPVALPHSTAK